MLKVALLLLSVCLVAVFPVEMFVMRKIRITPNARVAMP